jgi:hypothetical protein
MLISVPVSASTRATMASSLASSSSGDIGGSELPFMVSANRSWAAFSSASLSAPSTSLVNQLQALTLHLPLVMVVAVARAIYHYCVA